MDKRLIKLKSWGCDIDGAMERFLDDEEFYFECYDRVMEDPGFEYLREAIEKHDVRVGFENAHTLKGVIANLGLTSLYKIISDIVEPLRVGREDGIAERYQDLMNEREKYVRLK